MIVFKFAVLFECPWDTRIVAVASVLDFEFADIILILCLFYSIKLIRQVLALFPEFGLVVEASFS